MRKNNTLGKSPVSKEEILELMIDRGMTLEHIINIVIDTNGIIGVGLVTLAQNLYIHTMYNPELRREGITEQDISKIYMEGRRRLYK